jgi:hypothetical protein
MRDCSPEIETRLTALEAAGLSMTVVEILVRAGMHFAGWVMDRGEGFEVAQIRKAWGFLWIGIFMRKFTR